MASTSPRVQVTVDAELAAAMAEVDPRPVSRSGLIRELALLGARARREEQARHRRALDYLARVARSEVDYDPASALVMHAEREADAG